MPDTPELILGEYRRSLDERFRLSIPAEMMEAMGGSDAPFILAKERPGCLSLWNARACKAALDEGMDLVRRKIAAGKLAGRMGQVQMLGRLLSTRHAEVEMTGRGRLLIPEGFRDFLRVEAGAEVVIVGAAIAVDLWHPKAWFDYTAGRMPKFRRLFDRLSA